MSAQLKKLVKRSEGMVYRVRVKGESTVGAAVTIPFHRIGSLEAVRILIVVYCYKFGKAEAGRQTKDVKRYHQG